MKQPHLLALSISTLLILSCIPLLPTTHAITVTNESISPSTFSPDGNGLNDSVTITFDSTSGNDLYLNIFYNATQLVRSDIPLTENPSGTYRATWDGKDDNGSYVTDEGTYTIRVSENYGGGGGVIVGTVTVDLTPPSSTSISIDGGAQYTTSRSVNLTISATDASQMKISNNESFSGTTWETYSTSKSWQLTTNDSEKEVYINFRDTAGANISTSDTITLDTTLVNPSLSINGGASATNNRTVTLSITAMGASKMKIDNNTDFTNMTTWLSKASSYTFTLPEGADGSRDVYLRVKDEAGNVKTTSDSITLDRSAPTNLTFSINGGAAYTNNRTVTLSISADGASQMKISNNESFSGATWETYSTSKSWQLTTKEKKQRVYCKVSDAVGNNVSESASITLDTRAPSEVSLGSPSDGATKDSQTPEFSWSNPNSQTETKRFKIEILQTGTVQQSSYTNASTTSYTAETLPEGSYSWQVTVYDKANNSATTSQQSFTIEVTGIAIPAPEYPANNAHVNDTTPRLQWSQVSGRGIEYKYKYGNSSSNLTNTDSTTRVYKDTIEYEHGDQIFWAVRAQNTSATPSDYSTVRSFTIDTEPPSLNDISINNEDTYATARSVTLTLDATGASWMKLSEHDNFTDANWVAYSSSKSFTLSSGDGNKTVYFKVKDNAVGDPGDTSYGNVNGTLSDNITLDTQSPTISIEAPEDGHSTTIHSGLTVIANLNDVTSGVNASTVSIIFNNTDVTTDTDTTITSSTVRYSLPTLSDGTYTVNVSAADNAGNIAYQNWSFTVYTATEEQPGGVTPQPTEPQADNPPTIANIQHAPTTITQEDAVTITANITDDNTVLVATVFWDDGQQSQDMSLQTGNTYSTTIGPFQGGTTITYYLTATDNASQTTTSSTNNFTVEQTEEPPEEPPEETTTPIEETALNITLTTLVEGETTVTSVNDTVLEEIHCTPTVNLTDVKITINKTTQQPPEIPAPQQKTIYLYLDIETTANASDLDSLKIKFKVPHTWINNNNIDKNSIVLMRHHNNEWQDLNTTLINENGTHAFYEAETPGTSTFAITATTEPTPPPSFPPWMGYVALIIAVIIILGLILIYRRKLFY